MMMMGGYQTMMGGHHQQAPGPQYPQYHQHGGAIRRTSSAPARRVAAPSSLIQRTSSAGMQQPRDQALRPIQQQPATRPQQGTKVDPNIVHPRKGPFPLSILPRQVDLGAVRAPQRHRVLCYGDSLTAGLAGNFVTKYAPYAVRLSELLSCQVDHIGLSGWTTEQMARIVNQPSAVDVKDRKWSDAGLAHALKKALDEGNPYTCVIIMGGTNDLSERSAGDIVTNLMLLHHHAKASGAVSVAVAVPRHGALVCKKYENDMGKASAQALRQKIHAVNATLKSAVEQANSKDENGGWITFVDAHAEVIRRVGNDPQKAMDLFAGFPSLKEYRDFMLVSARSQGSRAMAKVQQAFAHYTPEDLARPIQHTSVGQKLRRTQPETWNMLEDPLHFSPEGYRAFAEAMFSMVGEHITSGVDNFERRQSSDSQGNSSGSEDM
eukprot:CAMPEP_0206280638 /NCGR_PEP_ID=MMETSP0047_2-20121206/38688_1 /ASSEMBLY_ACC=CAM_ASM_000192 /TAXON_ID=195065 /ORGANISM="Chroomonas mesostigmatica_cf, Strain CCMP1168" /LENGTH=434 /DNA_ID=CAMNT_0053710719 /DNA_START=14 /DNA_END=1318 /DNA_ORIENTATION=-